MPNDTLEVRVETYRQRAMAEQARLETGQAASGERWKIAPLADRLELAEQLARQSWRDDQVAERGEVPGATRWLDGQTSLYPRNDPYLPDQATTTRDNRPDRDREATASPDRR